MGVEDAVANCNLSAFNLFTGVRGKRTGTEVEIYRRGRSTAEDGSRARKQCGLRINFDSDGIAPKFPRVDKLFL